MKRLLEGIDENKIVIFRDNSSYDWHYLKNQIYTASKYVLIPEDNSDSINDEIEDGETK